MTTEPVIGRLRRVLIQMHVGRGRGGGWRVHDDVASVEAATPVVA